MKPLQPGHLNCFFSQHFQSLVLSNLLPHVSVEQPVVSVHSHVGMALVLGHTGHWSERTCIVPGWSGVAWLCAPGIRPGCWTGSHWATAAACVTVARKRRQHNNNNRHGIYKRRHTPIPNRTNSGCNACLSSICKGARSNFSHVCGVKSQNAMFHLLMS